MGALSVTIFISFFIFFIIFIYFLIVFNTLGKSCSNNSDCYGSVCNTEKGVCLLSNGSSCLKDDECGSGACVRHTCVSVNQFATDLSSIDSSNLESEFIESEFIEFEIIPKVKNGYDYYLSDSGSTINSTIFTSGFTSNFVSSSVSSSISSSSSQEISIYEDDSLDILILSLSSTYHDDSSDEGFNIIRANNSMEDILDAITYSKYNIFITKDRKLLRREVRRGTKNDKYIKTVIPTKIFTFNNYLYAIFEKSIYKLINKPSENKWRWKNCNWSPSNIHHISITDDNKYIWIQTKYRAILFNNKFNAIKMVDIDKNYRRNYGLNKDRYIECIEGRITVNYDYEKYTFHNIHYAVFNEDEDIIVIDKNEKTIYNDIVFLDGDSYYI